MAPLLEKIEKGAIQKETVAMFNAHPFPPLVSPPGACTIIIRSPARVSMYVEAWLAADLSLLKKALTPVFHCSAEQMLFFLPDGLLAHSPLPDSTWIRRLPIIGNTRLIYLVVMDEVPQHVRILVPPKTLSRELS